MKFYLMAAPVPFGTRVKFHRPGYALGTVSEGEGAFLNPWPVHIYDWDQQCWTQVEVCWDIRLDNNDVVVLHPSRGDTVEALVAVDA